MQAAKKAIRSYGIYFLAAMVVVLNFVLIFDNVLWGDEAFSANTVRNEVAGIMQIVYYLDSHPPLYYLWLRFWVNLLGYSGWVMHFASLVPFLAGILAAVTLFRKHFGKLPAGFFIVVSGLSAPCLEYNIEVRMYQLAFFAIAMCAYCSYRVICGGKAAWVGMVIWALVGAYTHYYALMAGGIMIFITGVAAVIRHGRKTVIKSVGALTGFVIGYLPWIRELLKQTNSVSNNWWNTEILPLKDAITMIMGGRYSRIVVTVMSVLIFAGVFLFESSILKAEKKGDTVSLRFGRASLKKWSDITYGCAICLLTVVGTVIAAYLVCVVVGPVLAQRYLYPLIAVTALFLVMGCHELLELSKRLETELGKKRIQLFCRCGMTAVLIVLVLIGFVNYRNYSSVVRQEKQATEQTLSIIGSPGEDTVFLNDGVTHIGWTVLKYYYPENELVNDSWDCVDFDDYWYFRKAEMEQEQLDIMRERGYAVEEYGHQQLSKYPFVLYHFQK